MHKEILKKAAVEQLPQDQAGHIAKAEKSHFNKILKLQLEYRSSGIREVAVCRHPME